MKPRWRRNSFFTMNSVCSTVTTPTIGHPIHRIDDWTVGPTSIQMTASATAAATRTSSGTQCPSPPPRSAFACIAHRKTERVGIDQLEGRVSTTLLTPYPPGIPLLIPGERFNKRIVDYLRFARRFNRQFPGFDTDVHGLVEDDTGADGWGMYVDCVKP